MRRLPSSLFPTCIALLALAAFILVALTFVFSAGVCCADDAYYAVVAKDLASGMGYKSTLPLGYQTALETRFDPRDGSGPTLILPAAVFIKLFGNTYWAPGLSNVFCWSLLLIMIGLLVRKYNSGAGFAFSTLAFLFLIFTLMSGFLYQWGALLGEVPAALWLILGVFLSFHSDSRPVRVLAGFAFALAALAKTLALLAIGAFLLARAVLSMVEHGSASRPRLNLLVSDLIQMGAGFALPFSLWEGWKFLALGPAAYATAGSAFWQNLFALGVSLHPTLSLNDLYASRSASLLQSFYIALPVVLVTFVLIWLLLRNDRGLRRLFVVLASMIISYSVWWVFFSIGWIRYYVIPAILILAVVALPFLLAFSWRRMLLSSLVLGIALSSYNWRKIAYPISASAPGGHYFEPSERTRALLQASQVLAAVVARRRMIVTQFWPTAVDLEYIMDTHSNFTYYHTELQMTHQPNRLYWAVNSKYIYKADPDFAQLVSSCKTIEEISVYWIGRCDSIPPR